MLDNRQSKTTLMTPTIVNERGVYIIHRDIRELVGMNDRDARYRMAMLKVTRNDNSKVVSDAIREDESFLGVFEITCAVFKDVIEVIKANGEEDADKEPDIEDEDEPDL